MDLIRVGAHYAVSSLFEEYPQSVQIGCFTARSETYDLSEAGKQRLAVGKASIQSTVNWEKEDISFAVLHFGDHNLIGGVRRYSGDEPFSIMEKEIKEAFGKSDIPGIINLMDKHFGTHNYSLWHLFKDEKRKVMNQILDSTLHELEANFRQIFEQHYPAMQAMKDMKIPLPNALSAPAEFILNTDLRRQLKDEKLDVGQIQKLVGEFKRWNFEPDKAILGFVASQRVNALMKDFSQRPEDLLLPKTIAEMFDVLSDLPLELNLWQSQNLYFFLVNRLYQQNKEQAQRGDQKAGEWIKLVAKIGSFKIFNGSRGRPESFQLLDDLLSDQFFRLSFWKVATDKINYRRFFNLNEFITLRMEDQTVFDQTHSLVVKLTQQRQFTGLRIDHVDGLYDPTDY